MNPEKIALQQKNFFKSNHTKSLAARKEILQHLSECLQANEPLFIEALEADLGKNAKESYLTEIGLVYKEISFACKNLRSWMRPQKVKTALSHIGTKGFIYPEPYGNTLIIAPWNYPYQLALTPAISALAAGNTVLLKPSEIATHTEQVLKQVLVNFPREWLAICTGDKEMTEKLIGTVPDYIFFTGSNQVGKIIMQKAAENLIPVTLELGGKSPVIITADANIKLTAKRIVFGKWMNTGQTCVAPDYILAERTIKNELIAEIKKVLVELYSSQPLQNKNYGKIINEKHFKRLMNYVKDEKVESSLEKLKIAPVILDEPDPDAPVMQEEIFGPILPVLAFEQLNDALSFIKSRPKPLACYLFTTKKRTEQQVISQISSGSLCINDTLMQIATPYLPFGGVGMSGIGNYHGKAGFDTFSHSKSILKQTNLFDINVRYPQKQGGEKLFRFLLK